ncbi:MAG: DNA-protecting protein DprA [Bacteroidetes bacterium]|nr:DNA-protecting protein DprA [Bacteroidota bacterium]
MEDDELYYTVALTMIPEIGPVLARNLIAYAGGSKNVFTLPKGKLEKVPGIGPSIAERVAAFNDFKRVERQLKYAGKNKVRILRYHEAEYPQRLKRNHDAPLLLYFKGNTNLNTSRIVSLVGTRNCSEESLYFTDRFVEELKLLDCLVVSGLAYGIDIRAHRAAVKHSIPTVAVVAHGLDSVYPSIHRKTVEEMYSNGGMLTEYPIATRPDRENFPTRNRIVAGMSDATILIESPFKGGAMITAQLAHSYNRDVFAVPGMPGDPKIEGNHFLIKTNKAALIESARDLMEYMNWKMGAGSTQAQLPFELSNQEKNLMNYFIQKSIWHIDDLAIDARISSGNLSLTLLELEIKGLIRTLPGKRFQKIR